jgi:[NiFe] hydrogenase diaphorase moiety large subunit
MEEMVKICENSRSMLLPMLQEVQAAKGCVSDKDMQEIADKLGIHPVEVYSVVTFYSFLNVEKKGKHIVRVSNCAPNEMAGSARTIKEFEKVLKIKVGEATKDSKIFLEMTGCIGMCDMAPAIMVDDLLIGKVTPKKVAEIVKRLKSGKKLDDMAAIAAPKREGSVIFDPVKSHEALKKAIKMGRSNVLDAVRDSNLKGRGGAGFPVGVKWNLTATANSEKKFVVCNADEGEPGTFKDKVILEEYLPSLIEGMTIAGFAVGADAGFLYLRGEYRYMVRRIEKELAGLRKSGFLGKNIMGKKGFNFDIEMRLGSGAYICGEETALIESLEGNRGEPRNKPPFPVNTGFEGHPTTVNNVETFVSAVHIVAKGPDWFKKVGTEKSSGSKLISVSGDCAKPGVYEVPFGTSIKEILKLAGAKDAKAVQVGGASGSCVPKKDFGRKLGYEDLSTGGAIMVFGKKRSLLDISENFLRFFGEESCGQCTPCRQGIVVLLEGVEMIKKGECSAAYLQDLLVLSETMQVASKCGLGQAASTAFVSIIESFPGEYKISKKAKKETIFNG